MASAFRFGNLAIKAGEIIRGEIELCRLSDGSPVNTPIIAARGKSDGPIIWLGAAVHGIELGGCEVIRRLLAERINLSVLKGTIIGAPIMNPLAFRASDRCTSYDRNDMNRMFGLGEPSITRTMAHNLYDKGIAGADYVIDYHSCNPPSINFTIVPAGSGTAEVISRKLAKAYGVTVTSPMEDSHGTLTGRAISEGKPAVCVELVFSRRIDEPSVKSGIIGTENILKTIGMIDGEVSEQEEVKVLLGEYTYKAVHATSGGLVTLLTKVGDRVKEGEVFALLRNPYGDLIEEVRSPKSGYVAAYPMQGNQALACGDKLAYIIWQQQSDKTSDESRRSGL